MLSFFWIVVILFIILLLAQWTVFLCVRKYVWARPKLIIRTPHVAFFFLSVLVNLALAFVSIDTSVVGANSLLRQSLSISYFFYLGVCLALFLFFVALGGFNLVFTSVVALYKTVKSLFLRRCGRIDSTLSTSRDKGQEELSLQPMGVVANSALSRRTFMRYAASAGTLAVVGSGSYGLAQAYEPPRVDVIPVPDMALEGLTKPIDIIQVTDLHYGMFYYSSELEALVEKLNSMDGAAVVITGDIFHSPETPVESAAPFLRKLRRRRWGNFAVLGNHDFYAGVKRSVKAIQDGGLQLLRNEWTSFNQDKVNIHLGGIDDPKVNWLTGNRFPSFDLFINRQPLEPGFRILLSHRPVVFPLAVRENIQLTLSGHTHGGQITVPIPGSTRPWSLAGLVSPYTLGMYKSENCHMYLNRGVGLTFIPARINCPPEIAVIRLTPPERTPRET
jgi:predicted MPP superfamily phosphohydrolase